MIDLNACPRCKHGAVFMDIDDSKHCVHCGFIQYLPFTPYLTVRTYASTDRSSAGTRLPSASRAGV